MTKILINILLSVLLIFVIYYLINIGNKYITYRRKIKFNKKNYIIILLMLIVILFLAIVYIFRNVLLAALSPILWAVIFAYLLNPIVHKLMEFKISRLWSVVIIYISIFSIIVLFSFTITPRITKEAKSFIEILPVYTNKAFIFINRLYDRYILSMNNLPPEFIGVEVALKEYLQNFQVYIIDLFRQITTKTLNIFSNIVSIVLIPIYTFYFLKDTQFFRRKVLKSIPKGIRDQVINISRDIDNLLSRFIRGQLIIAMIVGVLSIIALVVLKVQFAFLIGTIAGVTNIIPYFGPIIGAIPAIIVALLDEPMKAIWVIIAFFIIQQTESAILSPKIVGESVGLHPVFVILVLLIGGELFGVIGLIFAIPIAASIKIILNHLVKILIKI
jgi:predicted PurR-regulated permease PerM